MPINGYVGLMGSGKSYEVVSSVIVTAVSQGRRVVTNVEGLQDDEIKAYCHEKFGTAFDKMGSIVHVSNDQVKSPHFLCHGKPVETIVQPGDLVAIDEAWRFWGNDCKIPDEHKVFFREHRHYAHPETKVTCDLCVMVQDIGDLHRILRYVVEMTFRTHKLKSLGLSKNYRIDLYEGYKLNNKTKVNSIQKRYDKKIFPLYSSYVGGKGQEKQIDKRQNVLLDRKFIIGGVLVLGLLGWTIPKLWAMFHPEPKGGKPAASAGATAAPGAPAAPGGAPAPSLVKPMSPWRIVGLVRRENGETLVYLQDERGATRSVLASSFVLDGFQTVGYVDGEMVGFWSGRSAPKTAPFGSPVPGPEVKK